MQVPLLDLKAQFQSVREPILRAVEENLASGQWVLGPAVANLEAALAERLRVKHAVGVASGTDALLLALKALKIGVGDEVILPSFTFFATAGAVVNCGARPVLVEMEEASFNLDARDLERAITPRTKAVIVVHLFGQSADLDAIRRVTEPRGIPIVEDAAQAIGTTFGDLPVGGVGALGCFSFYPTKNLGGAGDGGLVSSNDDSLAARVRLLRNHGMEPRYVHHEVGTNSRLDALQAVILRVKLEHLEAWTQARAERAERYGAAFASMSAITPPRDLGIGRHVWNQYTIRLAGELGAKSEHRDSLRAFLAERGIGTEIYYPIPIHLQPCFRELGYETGRFPITERAAASCLSLPISPEMTREQQEYVIATLGEWVRSR